jgi:phosphate-selective porin OprO and OprP
MRRAHPAWVTLLGLCCWQGQAQAAEPPAAAVPAVPAPPPVAVPPAIALRFKGVLQVDSRWFLDDSVLEDRDGFLLRRARPILEATLLKIVDVRLVPDFAEGRAQIFDATIDVKVRPWLKLRAGKFKPPIGLERLQSDPDLPFMERALTANLSPTRDLGLQLFGELLGGRVSYALAVTNGAPDNASVDGDVNHAKDFAGRLFIQPFAPAGTTSRFGQVGVGLAASTGIQAGVAAAPGLPSFRTGGQTAFFNYLASTSDATANVVAHRRRTRVNPELSYYVGRFGLLAEYIISRQRVARVNDTAALGHAAWHATASVALGGMTTFEGVSPATPFDVDSGTWGALELALRFGRLTLDADTFPLFADPARSARAASSGAVALNWYPARTARCSLHFERTWFDGGAAAGDRAPENALLTRLQVTF